MKHSILFETKPCFKNHFAVFIGFNMVSLRLFWFQNGILGQIWLKMRFQGLANPDAQKIRENSYKGLR